MAWDAGRSRAALRLAELRAWAATDAAKRQMAGDFSVADAAADEEEDWPGDGPAALWGEFISRGTGGGEDGRGPCPCERMADGARGAAAGMWSAARTGTETFGRAMEAFWRELSGYGKGKDQA